MSGYRLTLDDQRFWSKVNKDGPIHPVHGQCWVWTAGNVQGYGLFWVRPPRGMARATRLVVEMVRGDLPADMDVLHKCDNPPCVNPDHLVPGTHAENMAEAGERGLMKGWKCNGEKNPRAKFTVQDIVAIRARAATGEKQRDIAKDFGTTQANVSLIVRRQNWSHV